ncbi:sodium:alanine symporter family protein [Acinetobacter bohemicus]|uniref:Sodium:alanine symporter family protein n=4 Tax=Gammaproteobacteria TaxID=1236 RepID=A0A9D2ZYJ8_ACILW|nr:MULTISPECIES: sodium:alanine symporter family protein [Acinetobacter]MDM1781475.1 sodium:alanine symporter family protein [Acinetobacter indicus]HJF27032.1 sodium:alanine symporter family protein [Acinetobacter lwoffii]MCO8041871.1 sodium:alanine symporter family protein [Acinetobacter sp. S4400-12]MCO8044697.1 sodium:alanine symporter family protein [Acinetobacter sp. S4397-1]MCU7223982.1 sodium:alanine symporter family protein [Acinetobacter bohemicus]
MQNLQSLMETLSGWIWGPYMLVLLVGTGVFLTFRLVFWQFRMLPFAIKQVFGKHPAHEKHGDISHFASLMTALSATIGTGNIAGVATACVLGGPGAIFWMWMTALFGMATKYGEGVLAVKYRIKNEKGEMSGGPMYYIERGLKWKWLALIFALFGTLASFGIGSSVQSNTVALAVENSLGVETWITGVVITLLSALVILGGIKSISKAASLIVPIMALGYVAGGLIIIFTHLELVMPALKMIFTYAFTGEAAMGGAVGAAIRYGVARGVFSNEAGMGSAPIAAAAAKTDHPVRQGLVSMTGTFIDTIIVCSITGIVLVIGYILAGSSFGGETGAVLTTQVFDRLLPGVGGWVVTFGIIFFAYSTILGWSYYGEKCATYLLGERFVLPYRIIYILSVFVGCVATLDLVWLFADTFNGLMAVPNLIALLLLSGIIVKESKDFVARRQSGELY